MDKQADNNSKPSQDNDIKEKLNGYKTQISTLIDDLSKGASSPQAILADIASIKNMAESLASGTNDPRVTQLLNQIEKIAARAQEMEQQIKAKNKTVARADNIGLTTEYNQEQPSVIPMSSAEVREAFKDVAKIEAMAEELSKKTGKSNVNDGAYAEVLRDAKAEQERLAHAEKSAQQTSKMMKEMVPEQREAFAQNIEETRAKRADNRKGNDLVREEETFIGNMFNEDPSPQKDEKTNSYSKNEAVSLERKALKENNDKRQDQDLDIAGLFDENAVKAKQSTPQTKEMRQDLARNTDTRKSANELGNLTPSDTPGQSSNKSQGKGLS